jgi:hypothetical protein
LVGALVGGFSRHSDCPIFPSVHRPVGHSAHTSSGAAANFASVGALVGACAVRHSQNGEALQ